MALVAGLGLKGQILLPLKRIDSMTSVHWNRHQVNLDSLSNPVLEKIKFQKKDSIVPHKVALFSVVPEEIPVTPFNLIRSNPEKRWFFFGQNNIHFNQSSFSNWNAGGNNSFGIIAKTNYNLSYKKDRHYLENIFQFGYGLVSSEGQSTRKTEDYINIASNYGYDLGNNYYLSTGFQLLSQFTAGYNYNSTPEPTFQDRVSRFMSPGYLNIGMGLSYNPNENFQVIFRPMNGKFTFVLDPKLQMVGKYGLEKNGQKVRMELGAMLNILYRLKIYTDVHYVSNLNFFTNYTAHPERVDISYSGVLNMKFNRFISAVVGLDVFYDHDQISKTQVKQTLGIGFTYNLGSETIPKNTNKKNIKPFISK